MPWGNAPTTQLTAPSDAGPNDPSIIIFPDTVPADIVAFYAPDTVVEVILMQQAANEYLAFVFVDPVVGRSFVDVGGLESVGGVYSPGMRWRIGTIGTDTSTRLLGPTSIAPGVEWFIDDIAAPRGLRDANVTDNGTVATSAAGAEAAVPAASWDNEPTFDFPDNGLFKLTCIGNVINAAATAQLGQIKIRKGSASVAGTILGLTEWPVAAGFAGLGIGFVFHSWVKNTSGATVSTKLSATIQRVAGAGNFSLHGDAPRPLRIEVEHIGDPADQPGIAAIAVQI